MNPQEASPTGPTAASIVDVVDNESTRMAIGAYANF